MVIHITPTTMGFNLTDTGHIPITDTDPTVISVGLTVLAKVLVGVDILGGVEAMVGTVAVLVADTMDGKVDMAATDAYIYAMWGSTPKPPKLCLFNLNRPDI
jgi:hypothetical protein